MDKKCMMAPQRHPTVPCLIRLIFFYIAMAVVSIFMVANISAIEIGNKPSFEKVGFAKKIESFDISPNGMLLIQIDSEINIYDKNGEFYKCVSVEKDERGGGMIYSFFSNEDIYIYIPRKDSFYIFDDEKNELVKGMEEPNYSHDFEKTIKRNGQEYKLIVPNVCQSVFQNKSTKIVNISNNNEVIFDDMGKIYKPYHISLCIIFIILIVIFSVVVIVFIYRKNKR